MINFFLLTLALALLFLNAFFVAAEFGMVKLRHTRVKTLREKKGLQGIILSKIHQELDAYLSACQLGITLASLGLGWIGEPVFAYFFEPIFYYMGITSPKFIHVAAFFFGFSLLSFLHIVIGELMPKSLAIRQSENVSLWTAIPLYGFYWLMYPFIYLLNMSANILLKIFRLDAIHSTEQAYSSDEIKLILKSSHLHGELEKAEVAIIEHTLDFADLVVTDIMRPHDELIALDNKQSLENNIERMLTYNYSRYPVYQDHVDNIIGIVHAKDYLRASMKEDTLISLADLMRPIIKVTPRCSTLKLLEQFRKGTTHLALVYHHERLVGFLTLDNLLQVMLGRINDEFHHTQDDYQVLEDGGFRLKGLISLYAIENALNIDLSEYAKNVTLSSLVFQKLDHIPNINECVDFEKFSIIIEKMKGARIEQVRVYQKKCDNQGEVQ